MTDVPEELEELAKAIEVFTRLLDRKCELVGDRTWNKVAEACSWIDSVDLSAAAKVRRIADNWEPTEIEQGLIPIPDGYAEQ